MPCLISERHENLKHLKFNSWLHIYPTSTPLMANVKCNVVFHVHGSVHRESMSIIVQQVATIYNLLHFCKLLYMFRVVTPIITRSTYNCNYSIWHWSNCLCYLSLSWRSWNCIAVPNSQQ